MDGKGLLIYILYGHGVIFVPLVNCLIYEYHFINTPKSWSNAQQYCREHFTDLATIEREGDLSKIAIPAGGFGWIGLHDNPAAWKNFMTTDHNSWRWSTTGTTSPGGYQNWALNEPNKYEGKESCVFIQDNKWKDYLCLRTQPCVCYEAQSGVKQFFLVNDTVRSWVECQSICRQDYQDLAMIESLAEHQATLAAMEAVPSAWIGLYREPWVWSDLSNSNFRKWAPLAPDNYLNSQDCVNMDGKGVMQDYRCNGPIPFICHKVLKEASVFHTKMRLQTKGDLSEAAIREELIKLVQERLEEKNPKDNFKLQWIREPKKKNIC